MFEVLWKLFCNFSSSRVERSEQFDSLHALSLFLQLISSSSYLVILSHQALYCYCPLYPFQLSPKKTLFLLLLPLETSLKRGVRTGTNISLDVRALYPFYHTFCFSLVLLFFPMFPVVFRLSKGKFKNFAESSTFVRRSCFLIDQAVIKMAIRMLVPRDLLERFVFGETNAASVAD